MLQWLVKEMSICSTTAEIVVGVCFSSSSPAGVCCSAQRGLDVNVTGHNSILCTRFK